MIDGLAKEVPNDRPARPQITQELKEKFARNGELAEAWQEFEDSLITRQRDENRGVVYKTDEASLFFSEDRLLGQHLNLRYWNSVPAQLVGLGILGTFIGLVWGLISFSGIDFTQTNQIREAIQKLLSGVSTAFVTSVWGMLFSLLFNYIEKHRIGRVSRAIADLQRELDRLFTLTTQEEISFRQEDELAQQTAALRSFSTDLANEIRSAMTQGRQEIIHELQNAPEAFSSAMAEQLAPSLNNLNTAVEELRQQREESSTASQAATESAAMTDRMRQLFEQTANRLGESVQDAEQSVSTLLRQQGEQIEAINAQLNNSQETLARGREMLQEMNASVTSVRQMIETTQAFSSQLMVGADRLENAGQQLTQASSAFNRENERYLTANRETTEQIQAALGLLNDSVQRFQTIDNGLQGIFAEIETGLNTYATTTRESINTYLSDFSSQLTQASTALARSVEALHETVEDVTDMNERLTRRRGNRYGSLQVESLVDFNPEKWCENVKETFERADSVVHPSSVSLKDSKTPLLTFYKRTNGHSMLLSKGFHSMLLSKGFTALEDVGEWKDDRGRRSLTINTKEGALQAFNQVAAIVEARFNE